MTLTRLNLEDGTRASPVHAPFFPVKKDESWWVVLTEVEHKHLITVEKITDLNKKVGTNRYPPPLLAPVTLARHPNSHLTHL